MFASVATAQADAAVRSGQIEAHEHKHYRRKLEKKQIEEMENRLRQQKHDNRARAKKQEQQKEWMANGSRG
eukprot:SAG11_NODE_16474_length_546_cov_1.143177_1_plen_70_part_01